MRLELRDKVMFGLLAIVLAAIPISIIVEGYTKSDPVPVATVYQVTDEVLDNVSLNKQWVEAQLLSKQEQIDELVASNTLLLQMILAQEARVTEVDLKTEGAFELLGTQLQAAFRSVAQDIMTLNENFQYLADLLPKKEAL